MSRKPRLETVTDHVTARLIGQLCSILGHVHWEHDRLPECGHWALAPQIVGEEMIGPDGHLQTGAFLPDVGLRRRMWASSLITFHHPIFAGMEVQRHSVVHDQVEKIGRSGRLVFVEVEHILTTGELLLVAEQQTLVYRGAPSTPSSQKRPAPLTPDKGATWDFERHITPDPVMLFRYSALTWNAHRIHYDEPYATEVEGYSGLVVHGPLIASLLADLLAREIGTDCLRSYKFRSLSPALCGEELRLVGRIQDDVATLQAHGVDGRLTMVAKGWI